jgi:undecaprenyl-diphosphatase
MTLKPFVWDGRVFGWVNGLAADRLDFFCGWPTYLGDPIVLVFIVSVFVLIWDEGKATRKLIALSASTAAAYYSAHLLKSMIHRPRPYAYYYDLISVGGQEIRALFQLLLNESSFPSAHAATVFAVASAMTAIYGKRMALLFVFAFFISFTRVYVGAHFPSDIVGGALVGSLVGWAVSRSIMKA